MKETLSEKLKTILLVSFAMSFTVFSGTCHLYLYNVLQYHYNFIELLYTLLLILGLVFLFVTVVMFTLDIFLEHKRVVSVFFILCTLLWLQGNILLWNYGFLDGSEIDWNNKYVYGVVDGSIWTLLLVLAFMKPTIIHKAARAGSVALVLLQSVSLGTVLMDVPGDAWTRDTVSDADKFNYSSKKNVIILVLDTFQTDIFAEIIREDSSYRDIFDGFTYFPDAVSGFPTTYPAIPLLLTGLYYDNSLPIQQFVSEAYRSEQSIPKVLKNLGYNVMLSTPETYAVSQDSDVVTRQTEHGFHKALSLLEMAPLLDLALFRHLPHFAKRFVFDDMYNQPRLVQGLLNRKALLHEDLQFINQMQERAAVSFEENVFRFYHLRGLHLPYVLNERLEMESLPYTRSGLKQYAKAKLKMTGMFLDTLKRIGIYDNTFLIIVADHGDRTPDFRSPASRDIPDDMSYLAPLVLIKPFGSTGSLKISRAPVSLSDMPATVFDALDMDIEAIGSSMFKLDASEYRERRYLTYTWEPRDWENAYFMPMKEFLVTGPSWFRDSWIRTGHVFSAPGTGKDIYFYGTFIHFGKAGNAKRYLGGGWEINGTAKNSQWTVGREASLNIPVVPPEETLILVCKLEPFLTTGKIEQQRVIIKINGKTQGTWVVNTPGEYSLPISPQDMKGVHALNIVFEMPDASSELELRSGKDHRRLGVKMHWLVLHGR